MKLRLAALAAALCGPAFAQQPPAAEKSSADGIAEYRKMLEDGNPADLFEAKGEDSNHWRFFVSQKGKSVKRLICEACPSVNVSH